MANTRILWADDEIELLRPHIMFLEQKGYEVATANNGSDAVDMVHDGHFDIVFLDEQMPGISGVEALEKIKAEFPNLPVVMITKSEEERIMEDAIGSNIADYLIKPVNPNQILLSLKRNLENKKLVDEKSTSKYQQEFRKSGMDLNNNLDYNEWAGVYKNITRWSFRNRLTRVSKRCFSCRKMRPTRSFRVMWRRTIATGCRARVSTSLRCRIPS